MEHLEGCFEIKRFTTSEFQSGDGIFHFLSGNRLDLIFSECRLLFASGDKVKRGNGKANEEVNRKSAPLSYRRGAGGEVITTASHSWHNGNQCYFVLLLVRQ